MKHLLFALLLGFFASHAFAQEEGQRRIQDLSMTPEETAQQANAPDFNHDRMQGAQRNTPSPLPMEGQGMAPPDKSFMEGYCDPNFLPILANNKKYFGQEQCLKQVRDNVCGRFKALPGDVKIILDDAIGCLIANGNGYAIDQRQQVSNDSVECGKSYMLRIEMLKKYWNDYYTNNALLFMPDDVLDTPGRCVNRNGGEQPRFVK